MIKSRGNNAHTFCKWGRPEKFEGIVPLRLLYDRSLPQSEEIASENERSTVSWTRQYHLRKQLLDNNS